LPLKVAPSDSEDDQSEKKSDDEGQDSFLRISHDFRRGRRGISCKEKGAFCSKIYYKE
jgi:hypothetical protein